MDKKMWGSVAVVAVIAVAGVWYFTSTSAVGTPTGAEGGDTTSGNASEGTVSGAGTTSGSSTIGGLLALGKNQQCSVTLSTGGAQMEGVIYLSATGKMRGDFSTTQDGNAVNATTINDGVSLYTWSNLSKVGYKVAVANSGGVNGAEAHGGVDNSTAVKYSCKAWSPATSKFVPPSNITFN